MQVTGEVKNPGTYPFSKQMTADELMNLNLEKLDRGIYVCKIQVNEKSAFKKFIKQ